MTDLMLNLIYLPMALFTAVLLVILLVRERHRRLTGYMAFVLISILGWQLSEILYQAANSYTLSFWLFDLDKAFVAMLTMSVLLFTARFFSLKAFTNPVIILILGLIPLITLVLTLIPGHHELLRKGLVILETSPVHREAYVRGPWYWVHAVYSYVLTILSFIIVLVQYRKLPRQYRLSAQLLLYGMLGSLLGNVLVLAQVFDTPFDFSLLGVTASAAFFFLANQKNHGLELLMMARTNVFVNLNEAVLVLDEQGHVVRKNPQADAMLSSFGLEGQNVSFPEVLANMRASAQRTQEEENGGGTDYYFGEAYHHVAFRLREKRMQNGRGEDIGTFIACQDVTRNRMLIEQLEDEAGLDALTGLLNDRSMEKEMRALDVPEALPLGVIACDVNRLKPINERHGRKQGDSVLRLVAEVLTTTCPPDARVGRTGGDEFQVLVPRCTTEQLYALLREIRRNFAVSDANYYQLTLALGASIRTDMTQRVKAVAFAADTHRRLDSKALKDAGA